MATRTWVDSAGADWETGIAWSGGAYPLAGDTADIGTTSTATPYSVDVSSSDGAAAAVVNITASYAELSVDDGGVLTAGTINVTTGTLNVGGEINQGTIVFNNAATFLPQDGTLDGVTWKGTLALEALGVSDSIEIGSSLTVLNAAGNGPGLIEINGNGAAMNFDDTMTLNSASGGNLVIDIGNSTTQAQYLSINSNIVLTLGTAVSLNQIAAGSTIHLSDNGGAAGGTIVNDGTISLTSGTGSGAFFNPSNFVNNGSISDVGEGGPTFAGEDLELTPLTSFEDGPTGAINVSDYGYVHIQGPNGSVDVSGTISISTHGTADLDTAATVTDTLGSAGVIQVSTGSTAEIDYNYTGKVTFLDATGLLALGQQGGAYTGSVVGMQNIGSGTHDNIDLLQTSSVTNLDPVFTTSVGGVLNVMDNTTTLAAINLIGNYVGQTFSFGTDGASTPGTDIWLGCFADGTRILTDRGEVAVEHLCAGDRVRTCIGDAYAAVRWIGYRRIDLRADPQARPIRIAAGAFGAGLPRRDLLVSPDHAIYIDGVLVPARHLVNARTVTIDTRRTRVTYFHVELPAHDVLLAEGLPAESWLDTGNRSAFENAAVVAAQPNFGISAKSAWAEHACAPLVEGGATLDAIRADLMQRAVALGHAPCGEAAFVLDTTGMARLLVSAGVDTVRLRSDARTLAPDIRRLGALIGSLALDGAAFAPADDRLVGGFHALERHGERLLRWTDGDARLILGAAPHARELTVEILSLAAETAAARAA